MGIDHIALIVTCEENLRFYEKLGFVEAKRINRPYDVVIFMKKDDIVLEVFVDSNHPERMSSPEAKGVRHIAFVVDDFEQILANITCEGVRTDWFGRRTTFTKDPDGQIIEIIERGMI